MSYFPMVLMVGRVEEVSAIIPMEIGVQVSAVCLFVNYMAAAVLIGSTA